MEFLREKKPSSKVSSLETKVVPSGRDCDRVSVSIEEAFERNKSRLAIASMRVKIVIVV